MSTTSVTGAKDPPHGLHNGTSASVENEQESAVEPQDREPDPGQPHDHVIESPSQASQSSQSLPLRPPSESSTIAHEQTPFVEFSEQVKELCHTLWPPTQNAKEQRVERLLGSSNAKFLGALRTRKIGRFLLPAAPSKEFIIERLQGGSFNRIIGITIYSEGDDPDLLILRVPRIDWQVRSDRDVAILQYVRHHTSIPVAEIKAFDLSSDNPLKSPYLIQKRLPGSSLRVAHQEGLSTEEWCSVAREIGKIMLSLQKTSSAFPGLVEAITDPDGNQVFSVVPFDIRSPYDMEWKKNAAIHAMTYPKNPEDRDEFRRSTFYLLVELLGRWRAKELLDDPAGILYWNYIHRLVDVASEMNELGFLGDNTNCLSHLDLANRNIMVQRGPNGSLSVTGVLDWDSAVFAPKFVSCAPPWWMWQDEESMVDSEHDETGASEIPKRLQDQMIKAAFDETVGEDFLHYMYQPQYQFARRLFHFAMEGNHGSTQLEEIELFLLEWADFHNAITAKDETSITASPMEDVNSPESHSEGLVNQDLDMN